MHLRTYLIDFSHQMSVFYAHSVLLYFSDGSLCQSQCVLFPLPSSGIDIGSFSPAQVRPISSHSRYAPPSIEWAAFAMACKGSRVGCGRKLVLIVHAIGFRCRLWTADCMVCQVSFGELKCRGNCLLRSLEGCMGRMKIAASFCLVFVSSDISDRVCSRWERWPWGPVSCQ